MAVRYNIPLPVLLDASGNEVKRLRATNVTITESLAPLSTATITLPADETLQVRSFVKLYTVNGMAGIFRTRVPEETYQSDTCTIQLEHALAEVGDYVIDDDLSVNEAANLAAAEIMSYYGGSLWTLGTCAATTNIKATLDNANVLNALGDLMNALPDYMMTFNFSTTPWQINIVARPTTVSAEGRLSRNIESAIVERDDTELCTRVYMDKLANGHLDADTISTYGVVERYITNDEATTAAEALTIAQRYLDLRKEPTITITISAQDLHQITGETLDKIELGTIYRLSLPDSDKVYEKIITQLDWPDVYGRPGEVTVTLADEASNLTSIMAGMQLQLTKVTKNTYLLNNAIKGDQQQLDIMSETINLHGQQITANANNIDLIASAEERAIIAGHSMTLYHEASVGIAANGVSITALETATNNISGRVDAAEAALTVQAEQIAAKVSKGSVSTQLAVELGNVTISGGNLVVSGYITASELDVALAYIDTQISEGIVTEYLIADAIASTGSISASSFRIGATAMETAVGSFGTAAASGGTITIPFTRLNGGTGSFSFNIADTAYYQDGVAAAYERGVQDGAGTITVDGVGAAASGQPTWSNGILTQNVYVEAYHENGGGDVDVLKSATIPITVNASAPYNSGVSSVTVTAINLTGQTYDSSTHNFTAYLRATASNGAAKATTTTITGTAAYNQGWNDALDACVKYNVWVADRAAYEYDDVGNEYYVLQASHREDFWKLAARK